MNVQIALNWSIDMIMHRHLLKHSGRLQHSWGSRKSIDIEILATKWNELIRAKFWILDWIAVKIDQKSKLEQKTIDQKLIIIN